MMGYIVSSFGSGGQSIAQLMSKERQEQIKVDDKVVISVDSESELVFDDYTTQKEENYGMCLWINEQKTLISDVKLNYNTITIETDMNLKDADKIELSYAGPEVNGSGNIRSNKMHKTFYKYWDDTYDNGFGNKLEIEYRPLDKEGNSIIGNEYPLYDWLSPFYLVLK